MNVLVTGMAGFLGSHLGRRLVGAGHEVTAILRAGTDTRRIHDYLPRVRVIEADLTNPDSYAAELRRAAPERAFHLAWYAVPGRFWSAPENLDCVAMTLALARALSEAGCARLVAAGSCAEYAWAHGFLSEARTPLEPSSLYGVAKNATRALLEAWSAQSGLELAWARIFFPYGPDEPASKLVPSIARALLGGETARCSHGEQIRDFVFVEDCARALCAIAESDLRGPVNVGTGEPVRVRVLVETLAALLGKGSEDVAFGALETDPAEPPMVVADARKLRSTGWAPTCGLEAGLAACLEWWRKRS